MANITFGIIFALIINKENKVTKEKNIRFFHIFIKDGIE